MDVQQLQRDFAAIDSQAAILHHVASFFPTGCDRTGITHHLLRTVPHRWTRLATCYSVPSGLIGSDIHVDGDDDPGRRSWDLLEPLCRQAAELLPPEFATELRTATNPVHSWLVAVHVATRQKLIGCKPSDDPGRTITWPHDGRFPKIACYSVCSPLGRLCADAVGLFAGTADDPDLLQEDLDILCYLAEVHVAKAQQDIAEGANIDRKTVGERLRYLDGIGYVKPPEGRKNLRLISLKGIARLGKIFPPHKSSP